MSYSLISEFHTPEYEGAWFAFTGDRHANRVQIERYLQKKLADAEGKLIVKDDGPWWQGGVKLVGLSYSHASVSVPKDQSQSGFTLLAFSRTHELGVDVESRGRAFQLKPQQIADRYFHVAERQLPFLDLWLRKEAYAKATRLGLAKTIQLESHAITQFLFKTVEKTPVDFTATIALKL
jgi:hypothetical protein